MESEQEKKEIIVSGNKQTGKKKSLASLIFSIVSIILFAIAAVLGWQFLEQRTIAEKEKAAKEEVQDELKDLLGQYSNLQTENDELSVELTAATGKIEEMIKQVEKLKGDSEMLWKYKKQSNTLRRLLKGYLKEIDSLNTNITVIKEEKSQVETALNKERQITKQLTQEKDHLTGRVELGSKLKTYNLLAKGVRFKSGGKKEKEEYRARKVQKVRICFTIGENAIAKSGEKEVYLRVADAAGDVYPKGGDSTKVFVFEDKEIVYSAKKTINYKNEPIDLCVYFSKKEPFTPQAYNVFIFTDGTQIGETTFTLE